MNHVICIPLFGKQESQELVLESWNQAKIPKDSESRRRKFSYGPLGAGEFFFWADFQLRKIFL